MKWLTLATWVTSYQYFMAIADMKVMKIWWSPVQQRCAHLVSKWWKRWKRNTHGWKMDVSCIASIGHQCVNIWLISSSSWNICPRNTWWTVFSRILLYYRWVTFDCNLYVFPLLQLLLSLNFTLMHKIHSRKCDLIWTNAKRRITNSLIWLFIYYL